MIKDSRHNMRMMYEQAMHDQNGEAKPLRKCTSMNELIKWCISNAFNVEDQDGTKYVVIDYEEMKLQFDYFLEKEKLQLVNAGYNLTKI